MRIEVSGVFNWWETAEIAPLFFSSSCRCCVTSWRIRTTPAGSPPGSRIGTAFGRKNLSSFRTNCCTTASVPSSSTVRPFRRASSNRLAIHGYGTSCTPDFQPQAERLPCRLGRNLHFSLRVEHGDRLGETVERLLGGSLDPQEPCLAVPTEFPQACRHLVERIGELADLVAGSAGKDEVQVPLLDLFGGIRQPGDRPQDPFSREKQEPRRDDCGGEEHHVHLPSHRPRLLTSPRIHRNHVFLVHPQDVVRRRLHPLEQGEKIVEIGLTPRFTPERGVGHHLDGRPELSEKPFQPLRLFPLPRKRYVSQFDLERLLETRLVLRDLVVPLLLRAQEHEHRAAVHPFQGILHLLAGDDAPVIFPEDDVDGLPQGGDPRDVVDPDRGDDDQQTAESEGQFLTKAQNPLSFRIIVLGFLVFSM